MSDHSDRVAALTHEQQKLLRMRLKQMRLDRERKQVSADEPASIPSVTEADNHPREKMKFSLIFFSTDSTQTDKDKYRLVIEATRFADQHGFTAVWTPERHFHRFGGLYPKPAVLGAALAMITQQIQVRAGSVVLPIQHPVRVAEEWSVIDNLSHGRVGISFASGWSPLDFIFAPNAYKQRKEIMFQNIEIVQRLWRGETVDYFNGEQSIPVSIFPKPIQSELPIWVSSTSSAETCMKAGKIGAHLLTALLRLNVDEVADNIRFYRQALQNSGYDPDTRQVTLMLHTFIGESTADVQEKVRVPLLNYLQTYLNIFEDVVATLDLKIDVHNLTDEDKNTLANFALERYMTTHGLFGTPETCLPMIKRLQAAGVNEVACLIDFGVDIDSVLASLHSLDALKTLVNQQERAATL